MEGHVPPIDRRARRERRAALRRLPVQVAAAQRALPRNVRALSWVSFANDAASELAYPVVPLFLTVTLGAPVAVVGLIEGIAEGIAVGLRGLSGWLSDRWGERRLPWVTGGYAGSAAGRVVIAAAPAWGWVLAGRIVDRLGKGARTAPRDALIRDSTPEPLLGAAFGYHRALDTAGAVVGPLTAVVLLAVGVSFRTVLWVAVVPGFLTLVLLRAVREARSREREAAGAAADRGPLPHAFWMALGIWVVFSLGNSSDVFLILRAKDLGLGATLVVLAYSAYNLVYASLSWPLGALSDRGRERILAAGLVVFALVYLGFAIAPGSWAVWPLFALYGAYIAATDGVARAWVADRVPGRAIGTAYGVFSAATGAALLAASIAAGLLWSHVSPAAPFVVGASAAALAFLLLVLSSPMRARAARPRDAQPQP